EGLDLYHILLLQFAREIGHAAIATGNGAPCSLTSSRAFENGDVVSFFVAKFQDCFLGIDQVSCRWRQVGSPANTTGTQKAPGGDNRDNIPKKSGLFPE